MTLHQFKNTATPFDFVTNPIQFTANSPGALTLNASANGRVIGNTGTRIWDTGIRAASSTANLLAGQSVTLPFIATNLPAFAFDAIIIVIANGVETLPYAFSNSADNTSISGSVANKILFWTDLFCGGLGNATGNSSALNNYMFGGNGIQFDGVRPYFIRFSQPTTAAVNYTWQIRYISYTLGVNSYVYSGSNTAPAGVTSHQAFNINLVTQFSNNGGGTVYSTAGYFEVTFSIADTNYRSLLNKYHWGISN